MLVLSLTAACGSQRSNDDLLAADLDAVEQTDVDGATPPESTGSPQHESADPALDDSGDVGQPVAAGRTESAATGETSAPEAAPNGASSTATPAGPGRPTGPVIRIGAVGTLSGIGAVQRGTIVAVQAWAAHTNDHGGLNGHPVEVVVADDRGDAAQLRAAVKNLVEVHHVVAIVGNPVGFSLSQATVDYLEERRVPMIGGDRLNPLWYRSPMLFPQASAADAAVWIQMLYVAAEGGKGAPVGWLTCREAQQCRDSKELFPGYAKDLGLSARYGAEVSITQLDFTIECRQAQSAGAKFLILGLDVNSVRRVAADCATQGYRPTFLSPQTAQSMADKAEFEGLLFASATFPWVWDHDPATNRYHDALEAHAPDLELSAHSSSGWVSALLFEKAVATAIPADAAPTAAAVLEGLWSIRDDTLGGLTAPLTFVRNEPAPHRWCYFPMVIRGGRWVATSTEMTCKGPA